MADYLPIVLPPVWQIFTGSVDFYVRSIVNNVESHQDPVDEDGNSYSSFVCSYVIVKIIYSCDSIIR